MRKSGHVLVEALARAFRVASLPMADHLVVATYLAK